VRVEVSVDGGETWTDAELVKSYEGEAAKDVELKWAWTLWKARIKVDKGKDVKIYSRATDKSGNMQKFCPKWNFRGVAYNGYGEVSGLEIV
jgi:sulfite oxidase